MSSTAASKLTMLEPSSSPHEEKHILEIQPARGWASLGLRDLYQYRELLVFLVWREFRAPTARQLWACRGSSCGR